MAKGGSSDIQSMACIKDLGLEETETEMMTTRAEGKFIIQHHHYHRNLYLASNVYQGEGDIVQGSKTQVKDSQIEALISPSGETNPPKQLHQEGLPGKIIQAALEWIGEEKIPPQEIENADDTSAGNQTRPKQILGNPYLGTSDTAPVARRRTKTAISHSSPQTTQETIFDMDPIPQEEFKELVLENEDSPKQQHPEGLPGTFTQAALERVGEEKIPTQGIENAEDSSDGNQNSLKQILGNPDPGTNDTASAARRRTNSVIFHSDTRPIQENIFDFDIDLILQKEFEELALENEDYKTALEMMNLYDNEDVKQNIKDFLPLFTTIWRAIQLKIVMRTLERHLASNCKIPSLVGRIFMKLISKYNKASVEDYSLHEFIFRADGVIKLGEQFRSNKNFIHAVVSFYAAGKLYKWQNDGNNSVERISDCVDRIILIVTAMNKQPELQPIVIDHVLPLMHEMTHMLRSIPRSTSDIRAKNEPWCLYHIGKIYYEFDKYRNALDMYESGIDLIIKQFGSKSARYLVYVYCLSAAGDVYYCMEDHTKAIQIYKKSLKAARKANEWENDEEKYEFTTRVKANLQSAEADLNYVSE